MATYQDTAGTTYKTRQEAAASNTKLGTNPQTVPVAPVTPAVAPTTTTPVITPDSLKPATAPVVSPAPVPTQAPALAGSLQAEQDALIQKNAADLAAATTKTTDSRQKLNDLITNFQGVNTLTANANATPGGVDAITPELNKINDQIRQEQRANELAKRNITEQGGGLASGAAAEISNLDRVSLQKQADLSIIQMAVQGRYDSAKTIADRAVAAKFEEQTQKLDAAKFDYTENKSLFTTAEQRQYDQMFADRTAKIADAKDLKTQLNNFALEALKAGAPTSVAQSMMNAGSIEAATALGGSYLRPKPAVAGTPETKNFGTTDAPIWKQYNKATGTWEDVSGLDTNGPNSTPEQIQKSLDQYSFLKTTVADAQKLADAAGPNAITQGLGNVFVGDTAVKRLNKKLDTLKVNLLTMSTDPAIKKYFGPQMTENDTKLMTSAGTTMDAYSNSPEELKKELTRYADLINRADTAVRIASSGQPTFGVPTNGSNIPLPILTGGDGQQYIITD